MIDTYLASTDEAALRQFVSFFSQVIGPERGRAAIVGDALAEPPVEAAPACGDAAKFYACIRAPFALAPTEGMEIVAPKDGAAVVGVWA